MLPWVEVMTLIQTCHLPLLEPAGSYGHDVRRAVPNLLYPSLLSR